MWAALRSDLKEFVTTVSAEGANTLSALDEKLTSIDKDDVESEEEVGVQSAAVLDGEVFGEGFDSTGIITDAADEVAHRRTLEETYVEELPDTEDVNQFLETLKLSDDETTAEISRILQAYPDTVNQYFTDLVPTEVSYEDFWSRYFYRCNEERIEAEWEEERAERARARKAAAEAIMNNAKQGWNIARHLVGDAAKVLIGDTTSRTSDNEDAMQNSSVKAIAQAGLHWGVRPPFVLQTNEDSEEEDDNDDEEELGWDDEEEDVEIDGVDDTEGETSGNDTVESEEIVFHRDQIQSQYVATQEEMDQLHQTIEMQRVEIERFKILLESSPSNEGISDGASSEVEQLRLTIFEKDTELVALRSKLHDTDEDDHDEDGSEYSQSVTKKQYLELKNEMKSLQATLAEKAEEVLLVREEMAIALNAESQKYASEVLRLKSEVEKLSQTVSYPSGEGDSSAYLLSMQQKLEEKDTLLADAENHRLEQCTQYESKLSTLNEKLYDAAESLKEALETVSSQKHLLDERNKSVSELQVAFASSQAENNVLREQVVAMNSRINGLTEDLKLANDSIKERDAYVAKRLQEELENRKGESPESSLSSAVNVDSNMLSSPPQSLGSQPLADLSTPLINRSSKSNSLNAESTSEGQDEDDWGDAWGDELDVEED